jgi:uncharacterized protein (TIGR02246 family)
MGRITWTIAFLIALTLAAGAVRAGTEDEVKVVFAKATAALNAHDLKAVGEIIQDSPQTLWITPGGALWGRDAILQQFAEDFRGTFVVEPNYNEVRVIELAPGVAQVFAPLVLTVARPGQTVQARPSFLTNQIYVKAADGWKLASISSNIQSLPPAP